MYNPNLLPDGLPPYQFRQNFEDLDQPLRKPLKLFKESVFAENKHLIHFPEQIENNEPTTNGIEQLVD